MHIGRGIGPVTRYLGQDALGGPKIGDADARTGLMDRRGGVGTRGRRSSGSKRKRVGPGHGGPVLLGPKEALGADNEVLRVDLDELHGKMIDPNKQRKGGREKVERGRRVV
ncbi:hypothetical protein F2P56_009853 [Juglans regia]|uniref:Uncharacterized protein n=1 Tax=Juglans regia TaxID=51240 RepID=A0A833XVA2_JUGRE|nr:hypothetical protein F2P56_009853 [Juglans regia]